LRKKVARLWPHLDERARRLFAASEARELGHGGVSLVSRVCGLSRVTITKGLRELDEPPLPPGRVRRPGAGRPPIEVSDPELPARLDALVEPGSRGDPESPLRWTSKSTRAFARELTAEGHPVSHETVAQLLRHMEYSLQGTRKMEEGTQHLDRDAQFRFINEEVRKALRAKRPVISVDTKKKELVGNYENKGQAWRPARAPHRVKVHDFPTPDVPRGRRRRQQRLPAQALEAEAAAVRRRGRDHRSRVPLPTRDEQVEQGRAPPLLLHLHQLARRVASGLRDHRQAHRQDEHGERTQGDVPSRSATLSRRQEGHERRVRHRAFVPEPLPRGLELRDQATPAYVECYLLTLP